METVRALDNSCLLRSSRYLGSVLRRIASPLPGRKARFGLSCYKQKRGLDVPVINNLGVRVGVSTDYSGDRTLLASGVAEMVARTLEVSGLTGAVEVEVGCSFGYFESMLSGASVSKTGPHDYFIALTHGDMVTCSAEGEALAVEVLDVAKMAIVLGHEVGHIKSYYSFKYLVIATFRRVLRCPILSRVLERYSDDFGVESVHKLGYTVSARRFTEIINQYEILRQHQERWEKGTQLALSSWFPVRSYLLELVFCNRFIKGIGQGLSLVVAFLFYTHPQLENRIASIEAFVRSRCPELQPIYPGDNLDQLAAQWKARG